MRAPRQIRDNARARAARRRKRKALFSRGENDLRRRVCLTGDYLGNAYFAIAVHAVLWRKLRINTSMPAPVKWLPSALYR